MENIIEDNDKIYEKLDALYDEDKFDEIIEEIAKIPRKQWSNKLWFRLIGAYSSSGKFGEATQELQGIFPHCQTREDKARYWYQLGYICYKTDHEFAAKHLYEKGLAADPDDSLGLKAEIEECNAYISEDLLKLADISFRATETIKKHCGSANGKIKYRVSEEEFTLRLGYLSAIRHIPGTQYGLGFDDYLKKFPENEKPIVRDFLKRNFRITNKKSLLEICNNTMSYNLARVLQNICSYIVGNPDFDASALNDNGKEFFNDAAEYFKYELKFLPEGGVAAWDICEKIGFARNCYACDILSESEYREIMNEQTAYAKKFFSSFEEYLTSLVLGAGMFMFVEDNRSVKSAIEFIDRVMPLVLEGDVPDVLWNK